MFRGGRADIWGGTAGAVRRVQRKGLVVVTEIWETADATSIGLKKLDPNGRERRIRVGGAAGRRVSITDIERELNQQLYYDRTQDPFSNGMLLPIRVVGDGDEPLKSENALTQQELVDMLGLHGNALKARLARITSETTLRRLRSLAEGMDDLSAAKMAAIDEALAPFQPVLKVPSASDLRMEDIPEMRLPD